MSSLYTTTGLFGRVFIDNLYLERVTLWSVNPTLDTSTEWGDSDCNGYTARAAGRLGATCEVEGKMSVAPGTLHYNIFAIDNSTGRFPSKQPHGNVTLFIDATHYWYFPRALMTDFNLSVNVDTEEVVGWTSSWGNDGVFYRPGQIGAPDQSGLYPAVAPTDAT